MSDDANKERLEALEARIDELKGAAAAEKPRGDEHYSAASQGWRMVTELVAGLGIGVSLGYGLDWLFGTIPLFLVLFTLLGFAAGVNVMLRTAKEFEGQPQPEPGSTEDEHDGG